MRCALLSNCNVESLSRRIDRRQEVFIAEGYGAWIQELANPAAAMWRFDPAAVCLVLDGVELLRPHEVGPLERMLTALDEHLAWIERAVARSPDVKFFVSSLDVPPQALRSLKQVGPERSVEHHWHERVRTLGERCPNVYVFELKALIESVGRKEFYSKKRWYLGGLKYSVLAENLLAREIGRFLDAMGSTGRKKCLALDLDHTLWGGVIGEEGVQGIQLGEPGEGARYKDFQRGIRQLKDLGVILAVVSKNNVADVREAFETHPHMILKEEDFASFKVNWSPKPQNLAEVAEDLAIGLDSFVYIDDNPVEREAVRKALPHVAVPDFPTDTCELSAFLEGVYQDYFFSLDSTEEDRIRTETYRQNAKRAAGRYAVSSIEEFLSELKTKIRIWRVTDEDVPRAAQLTQKTNQFNFTTRRYTEQQLQAIRSAADSFVYIASVADMYGDNGKTFLAIMRRTAADTAEFDTLLMSCRVMGRFIEDQILDYLACEMRREGISKLRIRYIPTKKNMPARSFTERLKGKIIAQGPDGDTTLELDLSEGSPITKPLYAELSSG